MHINLLCSDRFLPKDLLSSRHEDKWAGVDRGALILLEHDITPFFSVGDFDSVNEVERKLLQEQLNIKPVKAEKADTDLALAVEKAVALGFDEITVYGATGGRLDHFFGAVQLLLKQAYYQHNIMIELVDCQNKIRLLPTGEHHIQLIKKYPYISFIPMSDNVLLSLTGFKYNLHRQLLNLGSTLTISNEVEQDNAIINVHQGLLLQIRSTDLNN
ncbi:thiamine diphosphokinase [Staphylococcus simiae]|uniref:Thiamine diphosphokinase n=1 Tax=Staphylococcus simiae CCM 7213 = CCUG 51256 TaxID=911238 RepID=G5JK47_9STAP|nr:thiamine diphosphokinase [Staphylococcus simiae]EHJ07440.1 thiamine pyrophosphokinase [Staphylococcus simiae CCM 7213 = CCUG 51256]PNZ10081.1 thiamine diphosphokinase [Staphylococcus simiae]SNV69169.1 thiamin pyrophosphokinase [Staphylococcus simiae]